MSETYVMAAGLILTKRGFFTAALTDASPDDPVRIIGRWGLDVSVPYDREKGVWTVELEPGEYVMTQTTASTGGWSKDPIELTLPEDSCFVYLGPKSGDKPYAWAATTAKVAPIVEDPWPPPATPEVVLSSEVNLWFAYELGLIADALTEEDLLLQSA